MRIVEFIRRAYSQAPQRGNIANLLLTFSYGGLWVILLPLPNFLDFVEP